MNKYDSFSNHPFPPCFNEESEVLILGSFPSPKSREEEFYYAHPSNRFWNVMSIIFNDEPGDDKKSREQFILKHKIALYDSLEGCDIKGSSDSSIKNIIPANLSPIIDNSNIKIIICAGRSSYDIYKKYISSKYPDIPYVYVSSTSALNASKSLDSLVEEWSKYFKNVK